MNTLKIIFFAFIYFLTYYQITGQISINGTVTDAELNPISNALVEIINESDTTNIYSANTNDQGYFNISVITEVGNGNVNIPKNHIVLSNYPNPFNPSTIIYYELPKDENIEITIYDILGRKIRSLYNDFHNAGIYTIQWNGRNDWNSPVAAGIFLCQLKTKVQFKVHKMVLLDGGSASSSAIASKVRKEKSQAVTLSNSVFNYSLRVTGGDILESEFNDLSCSSDTTLILMVPKILKSVSIGPEGGKLETDEFSLTIPEGSFYEINELKLSGETDSIDFGDKTYSKLFRVDGLPELYFKDLTLKIKLQTQATNSISLAVGGIDSSFWGGIEFTNYDYYNAEISSGYAVTSIPSPFTENIELLKARNIFTSSDNIKSAKWFIALITPKLVRSRNGNFLIYAPNSKIEFIPEILNHLEDAVDIIVSLGFNKLPLRSNIFKSNWPVEINITSFKSLSSNKIFLSKAFASFYTVGRYIENDEKNYLAELWKIQIISDFISSSSIANLKRTLGRDVFYTFLGQYSINDEPSIDRLWHSLASWSEKLFPKDNDHVPTLYDLDDIITKQVLKQKVIAEIFNGLEVPIISSHHGIAVSALIEFLSKNYGNEIILDIYNSTISQNSPTGGLLRALNDTENNWWPNFFKDFIQGGTYSVPSEKFLNNITETIEFNAGDTLKYADKTYNDLSAKLFEIKINSDEIKNNKSLRFKLGPESLNLNYVKTLVFGITDDKLIYLEGGDDFLVGNLSAYKGLLACVVNSGNEAPYTGTSNINLDVKVSKDPAFHHCDIKIRVYTPQDSSYWDPWWWTDGSFKDNVYTGKINSELQGGAATGSMQVVVDDYRNILSLSVMASSDYEGFKSEWGLTAANVFPNSESPYAIDYKYSGTDVCIYVPSIYAKYTESDGSSYELNQRNCDENSVLEIKFHNWR